MERLKGRAAIVTGAGNGIGRYIALAFAREGAHVVVADVKAEVDETVRLIEEASGKGVALATRQDIGTSEGVRQTIAACVEAFGRLDCVVNNAATSAGGGLDNIQEEDWNRVQAVNVTSALLFAREGLSALKMQAGSSLVNISSVRANISLPNGLAYETSKAALLGLTRSLAVEMGPLGIRVNAICPGHIASYGIERWLQNRTEASAKQMYASYPLGRVGRPEEIASVAVFLASEEASFVTGQAITVDGGLTVLNSEAVMDRFTRMNES